MKKTYLIRVFYSYSNGKKYMKEFLKGISKTLQDKIFTLWINYLNWEIFYSVTSDDSTYNTFESHFYSYFNDFQIVNDNKWVWNYDLSKSVVWELVLNNNWFFPLNDSNTENTEFISNIIRNFEKLDILDDKAWIFIEIKPILWNSFNFFIKSNISYYIFKIKLFFQFFKYIFNHKIPKSWKKTWDKYFKNKLKQDLFETKLFIVMQWENKTIARSKLLSLFNNFTVFKNYPLNEFNIKIHNNFDEDKALKFTKTFFNIDELSSIYNFPNEPKNELSLLKVSSKKLSLPNWLPIFKYKVLENWEIYATDYPQNVNIIWTSDYRSVNIPIWIYDEDRTKHMYIIWKTGTWKSRLLTGMIINDIYQWKWLWVIDPHWDLIEDILSHIPKKRINDVIIFDPTDEKYPFSFNPLEINDNESKQVLIKWFTDVFKKMFWVNWNHRMEHILRMALLVILEKQNSTLFDIIKILTDQKFRNDIIENVSDDVVKNFWLNEFPSFSPMFISEAVLPVLNKISQLLSVDCLKNIFSSHENKLNFRKMMDEWKILLVKLPKWKFNQEIIWFIWSMFVTKIFQAAMWRQWISKHDRLRFFLYADEFQNFTTDTFCEILSEARKYWLWLILANQFIKQIPSNISDAIFGNIWTFVTFRVWLEDAAILSKFFDPLITSYDLSKLNKREFYCRLLVKWQIKDPFSLKSMYVPDKNTANNYISEIYEESRKKYSRNLEEAKKDLIIEYKDIIEKVVELNHFN